MGSDGKQTGQGGPLSTLRVQRETGLEVLTTTVKRGEGSWGPAAGEQEEMEYLGSNDKVRMMNSGPDQQVKSATRQKAPLEPTERNKVRTLFRRGIKVNKYHSASWIAWAKFEQHNGNPEVAKLLTEGISNFPHSKNIAWFHTTLGNSGKRPTSLLPAPAIAER